MEPPDLPICSHRISVHRQTCHCDNPAVVGSVPRAVKFAVCQSCPLRSDSEPQDRAAVRVPSREPWKLGDQISAALSLIGVTEERVTTWVGAPCGCGERREKLNRLSKWAQAAMKSGAEKASEKLAKLLGK